MTTKQEASYFAVQFRYGCGRDEIDRALVEWCGFDEWDAMSSEQRKAYIEEAVEAYACSEMNNSWVADCTIISVRSGWQFVMGDLVKVGAHHFLEHFLAPRRVILEQLGREFDDEDEIEVDEVANSPIFSDALLGDISEAMTPVMKVYGLSLKMHGIAMGEEFAFIGQEAWDAMSPNARSDWVVSNIPQWFLNEEFDIVCLDSANDSYGAESPWEPVTMDTAQLIERGYLAPTWEHCRAESLESYLAETVAADAEVAV